VDIKGIFKNLINTFQFSRDSRSISNTIDLLQSLSHSLYWINIYTMPLYPPMLHMIFFVLSNLILSQKNMSSH